MLFDFDRFLGLFDRFLGAHAQKSAKIGQKSPKSIKDTEHPNGQRTRFLGLFGVFGGSPCVLMVRVGGAENLRGVEE